jgi:hypothetical protein
MYFIEKLKQKTQREKPSNKYNLIAAKKSQQTNKKISPKNPKTSIFSQTIPR